MDHDTSEIGGMVKGMDLELLTTQTEQLSSRVCGKTI
jgi:hypothetical protein